MIAWVVRMLLATALIGAGAWLAERALRAAGAPQRWAWVAGLFAVLASPFVALALPWPAGLRTDPVELRIGRIAGDAAAGGVPALSPADAGGLVLGALWVAAAVAGLFIYAAGWWKLRTARRVWRRGRVAGESVLVSAGAGPAAVGLFEPAIVVPEWLLGEDESVQRLVVLHETEHLAAGDHVVLAIAPLTIVLMPWNAALWWMLRRLRLAIELDCDGRVLARGVEPATYGSLLLDVAGRRGVGVLSIALASPRSALERRIDALAGVLPGSGTERAAGLTAAAAVCLLLACGIAPLAPVDHASRDHSVSTLAEDVIERFGGRGTTWLLDGGPASEREVRAALGRGIAMVRAEETSTQTVGGASPARQAAVTVHLYSPEYVAAHPELASERPRPGDWQAPRERIRDLLDDPDLHVVIDGKPSDAAALESLTDIEIAKLEVIRRRAGDAVISDVHVSTRAAGID